MRRRSIRLLAVASAASLALAACGGEDDEPTADPAPAESSEDDGEMDEGEMDEDDGEMGEMGEYSLVADGMLTVCSEVPYAPFQVEDESAPSGYSGFDIDLVDAIADEIGLELAVVNAGFDDLTSGAAMAAGTCDMAASAMTITPERAENIDFSDGYYNAAQSLMVKGDSGYSSLDDLAGQRIGVQSGTTGATYAEDNAPDDAELVSFDAGADLFLALESGDIVAILQDLPVNVERAQQDDSLEVIETYETDENYGFAFQQGREDSLVDDVNGALADLQDDGSYDEIFDRYFAA